MFTKAAFIWSNNTVKNVLQFKITIYIFYIKM